MGSLCDFAENALLNHTFKKAAYTPSATVYMGLFLTNPGETGITTGEVVGNGYARVAIVFSAASGRKIVQNGQVTFPQCSASWGTIPYWGIMSALTGGNMLAYGTFAAPIVTVQGNVPFISNAATEITANAGVISNYLAHAWLNFMFRNVAYVQPNIWVGFARAAILDNSDGSNITELSGGSYGRAAATNWNTASGGSISNSADINFVTPTVNWLTITHSFLIDSVTAGAGNILTYGQALPNQAPQTGDPVRYPSGQYVVNVN